MERLVLLRPRLSASAIYTLLSKPVPAPLRVDAYFESAAALERREAMLRHAYAHGTSRVLPAAASGPRALGTALYASLLAGGSEGGEGPAVLEGDDPPLAIEPEAKDLCGQGYMPNSG